MASAISIRPFEISSAAIVDSGAADGFVVSPAFLPDTFEDFVDAVVPILQNNGHFRRDYEGTTLRDHLGLTALPE